MDAHILRLDHYHRGPYHSGQNHRADSPTAQVTLEITRGKVRQRLRPVSGRVFLIGTSSDCDLVLGDLSFPEVYAYLFVDGPKVTIRRLGAGPPLWVCGERLDRGELFQSDLVEFGPFELRIAIEPEHFDDQAPDTHAQEFDGAFLRGESLDPLDALDSSGAPSHAKEMLLEQDETLTEDVAAAPALLPFARPLPASPSA